VGGDRSRGPVRYRCRTEYSGRHRVEVTRKGVGGRTNGREDQGGGKRIKKKTARPSQPKPTQGINFREGPWKRKVHCNKKKKGKRAVPKDVSAVQRRRLLR